MDKVTAGVVRSLMQSDQYHTYHDPSSDRQVVVMISMDQEQYDAWHKFKVAVADHELEWLVDDKLKKMLDALCNYRQTLNNLYQNLPDGDLKIIVWNEWHNVQRTICEVSIE
jgi:hypothetical protein